MYNLSLRLSVISLFIRLPCSFGYLTAKNKERISDEPVKLTRAEKRALKKAAQGGDAPKKGLEFDEKAAAAYTGSMVCPDPEFSQETNNCRFYENQYPNQEVMHHLKAPLLIVWVYIVWVLAAALFVLFFFFFVLLHLKMYPAMYGSHYFCRR